MSEKLYFDFVNDMFNSSTAKERGIDNTTSNPQILTNLLYLIWYLLNPIRIFLGVPIIVVCAYRCHALNVIFNGASTGHPQGYCADIMVKGWTQEKLFNKIVELVRAKKRLLNLTRLFGNKIPIACIWDIDMEIIGNKY